MMFTFGALAGLYLRGLAFEYRAGWESTFLGPEQVEYLTHLLWGPASLISGITLPNAAELASLRFPEFPGENASRWIHLQTLTMVLAVVIPRLLLAIWHGEQARKLKTDFPLPLDDSYFRDLKRTQRGEAALIWVQPYSYHLSEASRDGLLRLMHQSVSGMAQLRMLPPLSLGDEDELEAPLSGIEGATAAVALFSLSATPEAENHGLFLERLAKAVPAGMPLLVIIDESSLRARFGQDEKRFESRRSAWRRILGAQSDIPPAFITLDAPGEAPAETLQTLESLMSHARRVH